MAIASHATHVAGTLIASGINIPAKGMAYRGQLQAYNWTNDLAEMAAAAAANLTLSNHSYGPMAGWTYNFRNDGRWVWGGDLSISETEDYLFGFYLNRARQWDDVLYQNPNYMVIVSAGNDRWENIYRAGAEHWVFQGSEWVLSNAVRDADGGSDGFDSIAGFAVAKNVLTIGACQGLPWDYKQPGDVRSIYYSSTGPTDDGRIKPDVVADGAHVYSTGSATDDHYATLSGTSQATPSVTGSIALLKEHYQALYPTKAVRAATLKALVIHTAREAGAQPGSDYEFGWGLMHTVEAVSLISEDFDSGGDFYILERTLGNNGVLEMVVRSDGRQPLKVTMCWTDPPGPVVPPSLNPTTLVLTNDLDLRLIGPRGAGERTFYPWTLAPSHPAQAATTGDNFRDNVEQIVITEPVAGTYTIRISHKNTLTGGSQPVSVILSGIVKQTISRPSAPQLKSPINGAIVNADSVTFEWQTVAGASSYILQIARDSDFADLFFHQEHIRVNHYTVTGMPALASFYWRVYARSGGGVGEYSETRNLSIGEQGEIVVWQRVTPSELDYQVVSLVQNGKGWIIAGLAPSPTLPDYVERQGLYRSKDLGERWERVNVLFRTVILNRQGSIMGVWGGSL